MSKKLTRAATAALVVTAIAGLGACGGDNKSSSSTSGGGGGKTIALLLPENTTARYESSDRPLFVDNVQKLCPDCKVQYSNATQDASKQQSQAEAALSQGADVLVLDPVDGAAAAAIVKQANAKKVPVISYDRLLLNSKPDYYVEFNSPSVGVLQATALTAKLKKDGKKGSIVMINGDPADNNAKLFKTGAHSVIDKSGFKVAKEYDTPGWLGKNAQQEMEQALTAVGKDGFVGVYAANDTTGGAAIAAMKSAGIDPKKVPVTGQDAELAGIQRIVAGDQYMTVYKAYKPEAEGAAELAFALLQGKQPPSGLVNEKTDNGKEQVPSAILTPVAVTVDKVNATVIKDGLWKASQICTKQYAAACKKAGIQ